MNPVEFEMLKTKTYRRLRITIDAEDIPIDWAQMKPKSIASLINDYRK